MLLVHSASTVREVTRRTTILHAQMAGLASLQVKLLKMKLAKSALWARNVEMDRQSHKLAHLANLLLKDQANVSSVISDGGAQEILKFH